MVRGGRSPLRSLNRTGRGTAQTRLQPAPSTARRGFRRDKRRRPRRFAATESRATRVSGVFVKNRSACRHTCVKNVIFEVLMRRRRGGEPGARSGRRSRGRGRDRACPRFGQICPALLRSNDRALLSTSLSKPGSDWGRRRSRAHAARVFVSPLSHLKTNRNLLSPSPLSS
jgi:hypothetical protein